MTQVRKIPAGLPHTLSLVAALALVGAASAQTPSQARRPAAAPAVAAPAPVRMAASAPAAPAPRRAVARRATPAPTPRGASAIVAANAAARSYPTLEAYINGTLYYDYEAGRLYTVQTSPRFLTTVVLRPGEKLIAKAAGDTVRWVLGETVQGAGANQQVVVLIKPIRGGLTTNVVLTTDQRTYLLEAVSREGGTYTSAISWNYPQEQMQALAQQQAIQAQSTVASGLAIDQLHFGYKIESVRAKSPRWQPIRVFDDGLKTYIQFPVNMAATDAPPLFLVGPGGQAQLVNYRYLNGYYVVDRLIEVAELRLGEKPQRVVRITRTAARG
ncbi:MAG: P-type conjugative transfer protein TrbG [Phenylobacterium sp.]|nr:P-type conjugative transfer protein TrbG [Phenylobacterium sp.]